MSFRISKISFKVSFFSAGGAEGVGRTVGGAEITVGGAEITEGGVGRTVGAGAGAGGVVSMATVFSSFMTTGARGFTSSSLVGTSTLT